MSRVKKAVFWPTVFAIPALLVLLGLGTWQVQRLHWKERLIATIEARTTEPAVSITAAEARFAETGDIEYVRADVTGRYDHSRERHLYQTGPQGPGWHIYAPLLLADGRALWVNRGYVPQNLKDPATRPESQPSGNVTIAGLLRAPEKQALFVPDNNPETNEWYWRDLDGMSAGLANDIDALPFMLAADATGAEGAWPQGSVTIVDLPNRHFGYALTWYGLAITLLLVYVPFIAGRLKNRTDHD